MNFQCNYIIKWMSLIHLFFKSYSSELRSPVGADRVQSVECSFLFDFTYPGGNFRTRNAPPTLPTPNSQKITDT